ncbi:DUF6214 family protein [Streptomyces sp. NBC_00557]|uniref:DUF6214 family protein n=1 Tax=Streptomyces sp. NBC_00557 TaxID=2975776 RepID=UPI002E7FB981|nr:DUF6214 family protein [Streptomyces sp. NBC_00557]WUC40048.1 DUF6214 family protein [Streptomyces sp. NBC_00557]
MWPAWKVRQHGDEQERGDVTSWFQVRLAFPDGARVDALAVLHEGRVSIEDVQAEPALSLADLAVLADWIEGPLFASCGVERPEPRAGEQSYDEDGEEKEGGDDGGEPPEDGGGPEAGDESGEAGEGGEGGVLCAGPQHARPVRLRGVEGSRLVAQEYRAAQEAGVDPVLAVMNATGRSRRRSLRLIAQARDAGFLTPRHVRRD